MDNIKLWTYMGEPIPHTDPSSILEWLWKSSQWPEDTLEEHVRNLVIRVSRDGHTLDTSSPEALVQGLIRVGFIMEVK